MRTHKSRTKGMDAVELELRDGAIDILLLDGHGEACDELIRVIRQGLENGRTLRRIRSCNIDYDVGTGGVTDYVCQWDDEPNIGNWRGPERNPHVKKAIESSPWRTAT